MLDHMPVNGACEALVVDDVATERERMLGILETAGWRVRTAMSGVQALESARLDPPDIIFMDIVMPGMNGYQATRTLTNDPVTSTIPIVMVTSKGQETDKIWGLRQGAIDYMVKPVSPAQLVAKAQATLAA